MSQTSFAKRQREKTRKEKAAQKALRRAERSERADDATPPLPGDSAPPAPGDEQALLAELAELHARFDDDDIDFDFDEFTAAKEGIVLRLQDL